MIRAEGDASARSSPWMVGRMVDEWGRRVNTHRLPIRHRPQGVSRPTMSTSVTKELQVPERMKGNLGIMRLHSV